MRSININIEKSPLALDELMRTLGDLLSNRLNITNEILAGRGDASLLRQKMLEEEELLNHLENQIKQLSS